MRDPDWLREPPPTDESIVYVSISEDAKLTPQITEALTQLSKALQDLGKGVPPNPCKSYGPCQPFWFKKCWSYSSCRIKQ